MVSKTDEEKQPTAEESKMGRKTKEILTTKIIMRRLPPTIAQSELLDQLSPLPPYDYFCFVPPDASLSPWLYARAYFHLKSMDDVVLFRDRFDGYIFVDTKGNEYPAMIELAPSQKMPIKKQKKDPKCGTIEQDSAYQAFLEELKNPKPVELPSMANILAEIEKREKESKENRGKIKTPLIEFLVLRKEEKRKRMEEKRKQKEEERIRREEERQRRIEREKAEMRKQKRLEEEKRREAESRLDHKSELDKPQSSHREKAPRFAKKQAAVRQKDQKPEEASQIRKPDVDRARKPEKRPEAENVKTRLAAEKEDGDAEHGNIASKCAEISEVKEQRATKSRETFERTESTPRKSNAKGSARYKDKPSMPIYQPAQRRKQLEATEKPLLFKDVDEN